MKSPKQPIGEEALSAWNAGVKEAADVHAAKLVKFMGVARSVGLSHVEIARRLNDAQHFSSASNPWSKNAVQRLAKRLKALALSERLCSKSPFIMRLLEQQDILFQKSTEIVVPDRTKRRPSSCRTGRNNCEWLSYEIGSQWLSLSQNELDLAYSQDRPRHMELRARGHSPTV